MSKENNKEDEQLAQVLQMGDGQIFVPFSNNSLLPYDHRDTVSIYSTVSITWFPLR